ncbi:MAG: 50S ribosomal protein L24 [Oscillospiraceae bacterium]|jgi:large subunit ribosomal protein L24|nr:50S ribosomal protein L24 [Oscillospiraceae bacterium]
MDIRTDDTVIVLSGRDVGKKGKVLSADPKSGKVIVQGVHVAQRHQKPRKQGDPGGIIKKETPIYASKLMRVCPKCDKPTRIAHKLVTNGDKKKSVRVCKKCGAEI